MSYADRNKFDALRKLHNLKGKYVKLVFTEHPISLILQKAGYLRKDLRKVLQVRESTYNKYLIDPVKYFTIPHYERLANYLDIDLHELIDFIRSGRKDKPFWFEV